MKNIVFTSLLTVSISGWSVAQTEQAQLHVEKEQYNAASAIYKSLIKSDAKRAADYYYYLGDIAWRKDKKDSAKYFFMEGVKLDEINPLNYVGIGKLTMPTNKTEGNKSFEKALSLTSAKNQQVPEAIAEYYVLEGVDKNDYSKAVELLNKVTLADPKRVSAWILLGDAYSKLNDGTKQAEAYNRAQYLLGDIKSPLLQLKFGKMYANVRNADLAVKYYNEGLAIDKTYGPLYRELGDLYSRYKKYDIAIENYNSYLKYIDYNQDVEFRYAYFLYQSKDYTKALEKVNALETAKYDNKQLIRLKAYILFESGNYEAAAKQFETLFATYQVKDLSAKDYELNGKTLLQLKKDEEAISQLKLAMQKDTTRLDICTDIANYYVKKRRLPSSYLLFNKASEWKS